MASKPDHDAARRDAEECLDASLHRPFWMTNLAHAYREAEALLREWSEAYNDGDCWHGRCIKVDE